MHIWYCHPYAGGPGIGRSFRPFGLGKSWQEMGHKVTVITARFHHFLDPGCKLSFDQTVEGLRYLALKTRPYKDNGLDRLLNMWDYTKGLWNLRKQVPEVLDPPDAIVVTSPHPFAIYPAHKLAQRFSAKLLFEVRDIWPLSITELTSTPSWHPFVQFCRFTERYAHRHADGLVSLLSGFPKYCHEHNLGTKPFLWAPNGAETTPIETLPPPSSMSGQALLQDLQKWRNEGHFLVLYAGSLGPPNAMDVFLDAFSFLQKRGALKPRGIILGDGLCKEALKQQAGNLGLQNVFFVDPIPKQEVLSVLALSDVAFAGLQNAPIYRYGISLNKLFDYMRAKKPVLCSSQAGFNPVSESGCGIIVPPGNPEALAQGIVDLMERTEEERRAMGEKGYAHLCATYDYRITARNYIQFIESL